MRGHTSNNMLASCLAAVNADGEQQADRRYGTPDEYGLGYHKGRSAAVEEIAILLDVERQYLELRERRRALQKQRSQRKQEARQ